MSTQVLGPYIKGTTWYLRSQKNKNKKTPKKQQQQNKNNNNNKTWWPTVVPMIRYWGIIRKLDLEAV